MLVLNRKSGESLSIMLGDGREVVIRFKLRRGQTFARLAITAPASVKIWRDEVIESMRADAAREAATA